MTNRQTPQHFPVGASITERQLFDDPYAVYAALRRDEPVSWIAELAMWYVVGYEQVTKILTNDRLFVTTSDRSTIFDTFGRQVLSAEGPAHRRFKLCLSAPFRPNAVKESMEARIGHLVDGLIDSFSSDGTADLRTALARRLPVQVMLELFGLQRDDEPRLRRWYDAFERALANFKWDQQIRDTAHQCVSDLHADVATAIARSSQSPDGSLITALVQAPENRRLDDEEIQRNASIVLFGGISTVEALILDTLWAFSMHPEVVDELSADWTLLPNAIEEVIRWRSPVQSATRHAIEDTEIGGIAIRKGDTVNCMLGAANRDPAAFDEPERFDIHREFPRSRPHLGFAIGPHNCLGLHLARLEARIAVRRLYERLPGLAVQRANEHRPVGYEFHQPACLPAAWNPAA